MVRLFASMRSSRGVASVVVLALVGGLSVVGLVGTGLSGSVLGALPGSAWLSSSERGDVVLANGANGAGVARAVVPGAKGAKMSVVQRGGFACVRAEQADGSATVNCVDDATFGDAGSARVKKSQVVVRTGDHAYMVEASKGLVRPLDPKSLAPVGDALVFRAPIKTVPDDDGRLLVLELEDSVASVVTGASAGEPVTVGESKGDLFGSLVNGQFAVVAQADSRVTLFVDGRLDRRVELPGGLGSLLVPAEVDGGVFPLLSRSKGGAEVVVLDTATDKGRRVKVKKVLPKASQVFATSAGLFVPDKKSGSVVRVDIDSGETETIDMGVGKGADNVEVFVKDDKLWVNNPNGSKAMVIDGRGERHEINKYDKDVPDVDPGWDAEPAELETPPPAESDGLDGPATSEPPVSDTTVPSTEQAVPISLPSDDGLGSQTTLVGPAGGGLDGSGPVTSKKPTTPKKSTTTKPDKPEGSDGSGGDEPPVVSEAPQRGVPPQLSPLSATAGSRSVTLSWSVVGDVDSYELTCSPECGGQGVARDAISVTVDGLRNGAEYRFVLVASNKNGDSQRATAGATPLGDVPDQVQGVSAEAVRGTQAGVAGPARVTWEPETSLRCV